MHILELFFSPEILVDINMQILYASENRNHYHLERKRCEQTQLIVVVAGCTVSDSLHHVDCTQAWMALIAFKQNSVRPDPSSL